MNYWMHRIKPAGDRGQAVYSKELFDQHNILTTGWSKDLLTGRLKNKPIEVIREALIHKDYKNQGLQGLHDLQYFFEMQIGDIVAVPNPLDTKTFRICRITGDIKRIAELPIQKINTLNGEKISFYGDGYLGTDTYQEIDIGVFREVEILSEEISAGLWFDPSVTWKMTNDSDNGRKNIKYIERYVGDAILKKK